MLDKNKIMRTFGERFTKYMIEHDLRDTDMARLLNMSSMNMPAYKNGTRLPNPWYLVLIAEKFDCTVNDLLGYDGYYVKNKFTREPATTKFTSLNRYELYFRDRLAGMLRVRDVSVSELAALVNKTEGTVRNTWLGTRPRLPDINNLLHICSALNCTPSDLLGY